MPQKPNAGPGKRKIKNPRGSKKETGSKTQRERFIEAARTVGVDESGKEFERALSKIVPARKT